MTPDHLARITNVEKLNEELKLSLELARRDAVTPAQRAFLDAAIAYAEAKRSIEKQAAEYKRTLAVLMGNSVVKENLTTEPILPAAAMDCAAALAKANVAEWREKAELLDKMQEMHPDTIYLDDGQIIDVGGQHGGNLLAALRAAKAGKK